MKRMNGQQSASDATTLVAAGALALGFVLLLVRIADGIMERNSRKVEPAYQAACRAAIDDEPTTAEDLADIEAGRVARARGEFTDWRELRQRRRDARAAASVAG